LRGSCETGIGDSKRVVDMHFESTGGILVGLISLSFGDILFRMGCMPGICVIKLEKCLCCEMNWCRLK
jgi:hypothetical protein